MKKQVKTNNTVLETTPEAEVEVFPASDSQIETEKPKSRMGRPPGKKGVKKLTIAQKAEIAALYASGTCSFADLAAKYNKSADVVKRVVKAMGVVKGSNVQEATKKITEQIEQRALTDLEVVMQKIVKAKEEYYLMNNALAKMVWNEIKTEKSKESPDIGRLKDTMATLKMASELITNSRKEIFSILNVERFDEDRSTDQLPELTVRELTGAEIKQLQMQQNDDDLGGSMMDEDESGEEM